MSKLHWLSSIRGLAVLLVFISHLSLTDIHFVEGRIGVALFFLMSGFLGIKALEKKNRKQFLFNRFMRMYPIYWILVTIVFILLYPKYTLFGYLYNLTLFEEFFHFPRIIGASWMMPIQVIFFILISVTYKQVRVRSKAVCGLVALIAIGIGLLRMKTGIPFPTAILVLMGISYLGAFEYWNDPNILLVLVFTEIGIIVSSALSYANWYFYIIAYNISFLLWWAFRKWNISVPLFEHIGDLGFTFFLGAEVVQIACVEFFVEITQDYYFYSVIKFIITYIFSWLVTRYIEKPLLTWGKKRELIFR